MEESVMEIQGFLGDLLEAHDERFETADLEWGDPASARPHRPLCRDR
jgi:hypothetical protein